MATSERAAADTTEARTLANSPSGSSGYSRKRWSVTTIPSTESPEELEALVGVPARMLGAPRPVHDRGSEHRGVRNRPPEAFVQVDQPFDREQRTEPSLS